ETGSVAECDGEDLVRREHDTAARQGVDLSSRQRVLYGVRGFVEPLACRSDRRSRMERSDDAVGSTSVGRADAGDLRPVLGGFTSVRTVRAWERRAPRAADEGPL